MKKLKFVIISSILILFMSGCISHKISLQPELYKIKTEKVDKRININVGYYISDKQRNLMITTPTKSGDDLIYFPYRDTEKALGILLTRFFTGVYAINNLKNKEKLLKSNIRYIFLPKIKAVAYSNSFLSWPPTKFTVELNCKAINLNNKVIWQNTVYSEGISDSSEWASDYYFSLAAQRATKKAFQKMFLKLNNTNIFK